MLHKSKSMIVLSDLTRDSMPSMSKRAKTNRASTTCCDSPTTSAADNKMTDWMYWQRDANNAQSWTKVFALLENEFLWLYQGQVQAQSLLIQIAVARVQVAEENCLTVFDPNNESLQLSLYDPTRLAMWRHQLQSAAGLTAAYFRVFELTTKDLSRNSAYRGSLVSYRQKSSTRSKCKAAIQGLVKRCKKAFVPQKRARITIS